MHPYLIGCVGVYFCLYKCLSRRVELICVNCDSNKRYIVFTVEPEKYNVKIMVFICLFFVYSLQLLFLLLLFLLFVCFCVFVVHILYIYLYVIFLYLYITFRICKEKKEREYLKNVTKPFFIGCSERE